MRTRALLRSFDRARVRDRPGSSAPAPPSRHHPTSAGATPSPRQIPRLPPAPRDKDRDLASLKFGSEHTPDSHAPPDLAGQNFRLGLGAEIGVENVAGDAALAIQIGKQRQSLRHAGQIRDFLRGASANAVAGVPSCAASIELAFATDPAAQRRRRHRAITPPAPAPPQARARFLGCHPRQGIKTAISPA